MDGICPVGGMQRLFDLSLAVEVRPDRCRYDNAEIECAVVWRF